MEILQLVYALILAAFVRSLWQIARVPLARARNNRQLKGVPSGTKSHWLWGFMKELVKRKDERLDFFFDCQKEKQAKTLKYDPPIFQKNAFFVTSDPVLVRHILKDEFDVWTKSVGADRPVDPFRELMGDGIFAIDHGKFAEDQGEGWLQQRKMASHIFTQHNFREFFQRVFVENGHELVNQLKQVVGQEPVDLQDYFFRYTMDSFGEIGFGTRFGTLKGNSNAYAEAFDAAHHCILPLAQEEGIKAFLLDMLVPFPLNALALLAWKKTNKVYKKFTNYVKELDVYSYAMIAEREKDPDVGKKSDLLSSFMSVRDDNGEKLSKKFLRDIILNFIIAGRDTTACTLSWTFYELSRRPEVLEKLVAEINESLRGEEPTYESLKDLPYLHGVIYETLRLHPPVPLDSKVAAVDNELPDGTVVPRGTRIAFFPWGMGRDEGMWPDPMAFQPERWAKGAEVKDQFEFPVFQAGRRVCLGLAMAVFEAKTVTTMLLQNFRFDLVPDQPITYSRTLTMSIKGGVKMHVKSI